MKLKNIRAFFMLLLLFPAGISMASFSGPYLLYTLEEFDPGNCSIDQIPNNLYLAPQIKDGDLGEGPQRISPKLLQELASLKAKQYMGTKISETLPSNFPVKNKRS